jgi:hypothetical protein
MRDSFNLGPRHCHTKSGGPHPLHGGLYYLFNSRGVSRLQNMSPFGMATYPLSGYLFWPFRRARAHPYHSRCPARMPLKFHFSFHRKLCI